MLGDRFPEPPDRLPAGVGMVDEELSAWRLHWEEGSLETRLYPTGKYVSARA